MALFGRRGAKPVSIETEHERLRAIRIAAEQELGRLRRELTERVAAVERRERELADILAQARRTGLTASAESEDTVLRAHGSLAARARELSRREDALTARELALAEREAEAARRAAVSTPEERLAEIETRLAALREAEQAFARTRAELAARTDDLDRREADLLERARDQGALAGTGLSRAELAELDERLRRLERETREASSAGSFGEGLRALERKGLSGSPPVGG